MKKILLLFAAAAPVLVTSCASTPQHPAYHNIDNSALVVASLDNASCQVIAPTAIPKEDNLRLLDQAKSFGQHQTAVVILENYNEPKPGQQFRDRTLGWFIGLRGLGYQHIVFLQGQGTGNPNGLPTLAEYD